MFHLAVYLAYTGATDTLKGRNPARRSFTVVGIDNYCFLYSDFIRIIQLNPCWTNRSFEPEKTKIT